MSNTNSRAPKRTMKFDAATLIASIEGIGEIDGAAITEAVRTELFGVGLITILGRSQRPEETYREMCAGTWGKRGSAAPVSKPVKPLSLRRQAIAHVRVVDKIQAKKSGGEKVTQQTEHEIIRQVDIWVRSLSKEQVARAHDVAAVKVAYAELTGSAALSLDDAMAETQIYARPAEETHEDAAA